MTNHSLNCEINSQRGHRLMRMFTGVLATGGVDHDILVKETASVMLTTNVDIADRLSTVMVK